MNVDSYTVTVSANGYQTVNIPNVVVFGDETDTTGVVSMSKQLTEIAHVTSRSVSSAYQPTQTIDSYTVNQQQILQATGKANSTSENAILLSVPGVTLTDTGSPTIRGGAASEVGYQLDGVTFREPFLSMNGGQGLVNGLGSVQIVEGAGDATQGGVGSGVINVIPPRGSGPGTGEVDLEAGGPNFSHQFSVNYGFSTPDNRFSEYFSYTGQRYMPYFGYSFTPLNQYGNYFAATYQTTDQFSNNFFFNFGRNNSQTLQFFYANTSARFYEPFTQPYYYLNDPLTQPVMLGQLGYTPGAGNPAAPAGLTPAQWSAIAPLTEGVSATGAPPSPQQLGSNQTEFVKLEYDNRLNPTTYFDLRYYNWNYLSNTDTSETLGAWGSGLAGFTANETVGGPTSGFSADLEKQIGANLTVSLEGQYNSLRPQFDAIEPPYTLITLDGSALPNAITLGDFYSGGYLCDNSTFQATVGACPAAGYTTGRLPGWGIDYHGTQFQDWGAGLRVQWQASDNLKFDLGVRDEGQNLHWNSELEDLGLAAPSYGYAQTFTGVAATDPMLCAQNVAAGAGAGLSGAALGAAIAAAGCPTTKILSPYDVLNQLWNSNFLHPTVLQPRASVSYQLSRWDALRFGYGRSAVFPNAQTAGTPFEMNGLSAYTGIPAKPGSLCGWATSYEFPCYTAAEQLYWEGDNQEAPDAGQTAPAIYSNYDVSWNHLFKNGWGLRVTPFAKLGTDLPTYYYLNPILGIFATSNQGYNKTNGVELGLTTPQTHFGLSGYFTATYQNVLSTTPPLSSGETTVPFISNASLDLGDLYRAGYVSPFTINIGAVENLKNGLTISPQLNYNIGYPYSVGNLIAAQLAGGQYANLPQVDFGPGITGGVSSFIGTAPGSAISTNYYDPAYAGSVGNPNIDATRGTPSTAVNGGKLSHPNLTADLAIQWKRGPNTFGVQFTNLFGNAWIGSVPAINTYYQPVANGLSGPQTNYNSCVTQVGAGNRGCVERVPSDLYAFSNGAYLLSNGDFNSGEPGFGPLQPFAFRVYYQRAL